MSVKPNALGWILGAVLSLAASRAWAQKFEQLVPPEPNHRGRFDMFAPPDLSTFGSGPPANEGYFFNADFLQWAVETPEKVRIGSTTPLVEGDFVIHPFDSRDAPLILARFAAVMPGTDSSGLDTSQWDASIDLKSGRRFEGGWVEGNYGVLISFSHLRDEDAVTATTGPIDTNSDINFPIQVDIDGDGDLEDFFTDPGDAAMHGALVVFNDTTFAGSPNFGVSFSDLTANNIVHYNRIEAMGLYRYDRKREPNSGQFEWLYGVRYLDWDEEYNVNAFFGDRPVDAVLLSRSLSSWNTNAKNQLIGPQVGMRYSKTNRRWGLNIEARFLAAANFQNLSQVDNVSVVLADAIEFSRTGGDLIFVPPNFTPTELFEPTVHTHGTKIVEFSPTSEVRIEGAYQLTRRLRIKAGWNALYVANLARPSQMMEWNYPAFGINVAENRQDVFTNGFDLGLEFNR